jgi:hypothetical protein
MKKMKDEGKNRERLIKEIASLRLRVKELERVASLGGFL